MSACLLVILLVIGNFQRHPDFVGLSLFVRFTVEEILQQNNNTATLQRFAFSRQFQQRY